MHRRLDKFFVARHSLTFCTLVKLCWLQTARLCSVYDCYLPSPRMDPVAPNSSTGNSSSAGVPKVSGSIAVRHGDNSSRVQWNHAFISTYWRWIYTGCALHTKYTWRRHPWLLSAYNKLNSRHFRLNVRYSCFNCEHITTIKLSTYSYSA